MPNVIVWTENVAFALSALDPAHADAYTAAASAYRAELEALNSELHALAESLPAEQRKMVTDHDSLGYLAHEYGFTVVGTVIPSLSTVGVSISTRIGRARRADHPRGRQGDLCGDDGESTTG